LTLTGQLGDVMKESAQAALSYVRSRERTLGINADVFTTQDLHIHVPAGAIPKDGPSAGITMAIAIASTLSQIPVRRDLAMTGEITLRGRVLPIGGLKEKLLAAKRAKLTTVILPKRNKKDLDEIPKHILKGIHLIFADTMDDVMTMALRRGTKSTRQTGKPNTSQPHSRKHTTRAKPGRAARSLPMHAAGTVAPPSPLP
jgi:ATP-dependent Lon protease